MKVIKANNQRLLILSLIIALTVVFAVIFGATTANALEKEMVDDFGNTYTVTYPDKPQFIMPDKISETTIKISWVPATYWAEGKFEVCKYDSSAKKWVHLAYTEKNTYTVKNLKKNTKYKFAVREYYEFEYPDKKIKRFGEFSQTLSAYTSTSAPTLSKASYKSKGKINIQWKKVKDIKGYLVQYSTSKTFAEKNTCTVVVSDASKKEKTVSGLFAKDYYVRICTYQTAGGRKFCSKWSKTKTVKVKKGVTLKEAINCVKTDLSGRDAIKDMTNKGVDIKKYGTTYDRMKAIFNWHAKHYKDFANCVECNASFASCVNALYGEKKKYDDFIWLAADNFKNSNGKVVQHKWCVLYINGVHHIFDPRLQGYTGNYTGSTYFGKTKGSDIGKKYLFDYWYAHWRYGYKGSDKIVTT